MSHGTYTSPRQCERECGLVSIDRDAYWAHRLNEQDCNPQGDDHMKAFPEQSAELKMALKHDPVTEDLREEARRFPEEAGEAYDEVLSGRDKRTPGSWADEQIHAGNGSSIPGGVGYDAEKDTSLALWFTPQAIRDHFDGDEGPLADAVRDAPEDKLREVGAMALGGDSLYAEFHRLLKVCAEDVFGVPEDTR